MNKPREELQSDFGFEDGKGDNTLKQTIGEFQRNIAEKVVASLEYFNDTQRIDIRIYQQQDNKPDNWVPTKEGINIEIGLWSDYKKLINEVVSTIGYRAIHFGTLAVEKGFIKPAQIIDAMTIQVREDVDKREHTFLGEILVSLGYITPSQKEEVLEEMTKENP